MNPQIKIIIDAKGNVTVAPQGIKGDSCLTATKAIEEALGKTVKSEPTQEMAERPTDAQAYYQA